MGRMHSDTQFAGSSSVPVHVEKMGLLGIGNNPTVESFSYRKTFFFISILTIYKARTDSSLPTYHYERFCYKSIYRLIIQHRK